MKRREVLGKTGATHVLYVNSWIWGINRPLLACAK